MRHWPKNLSDQVHNEVLHEDSKGNGFQKEETVFGEDLKDNLH